MFTAPTEDTAGLVAVTDVDVDETTVPAVVPKRTAVAPERFVPVTVTVVPPLVGPTAGDTPVTAGSTKIAVPLSATLCVA